MGEIPNQKAMKEGVLALEPDTLTTSASASRAGQNTAVVYSQVDLVVNYPRHAEGLGL
jgi:hypothetical protein